MAQNSAQNTTQNTNLTILRRVRQKAVGWRALVTRLRRNSKGATAVEFALIAGPLIFMIMACFELALVVLVSVTLDGATEKAAREIRTGIMTKASSVNDFKAKVCSNMDWLGSGCLGNIEADVSTFANFSLVVPENPVVNGEFNEAGMGYTIGDGSQIQVVTVYYKWKLITPFLNAGLQSLSDGSALLSAKVVFKNEPF